MPQLGTSSSLSDHSSAPASASTPTENVFLFVPNLIGYGRVILLIASLCFLRTNPLVAMTLYAGSCLLDAADGHAARYFGQSSRFGAVLDMVTDRSSTAALTVYLATTSSNSTWTTLAYQLLIALDLSSHYMQMYASLIAGHASHKTVSDRTPALLRLYYTNQRVLFLVCAGNELFFIVLYLWSAGWHSSWVWTAGVVAAPVFLLKQALNVVQLVGASVALANSDLELRRKGKQRAE